MEEKKEISGKMKEHLEKLNKSKIGTHHSEETKRKMSLSLKGKKHTHTEAFLKKQADNREKKRIENELKKSNKKDGRTSQERREQVSKQFKGKPFTEEHRQHLKEALKNRTIEWKDKISQSNKGKHNKGIARPEMRGENSPNWKGGLTILKDGDRVHPDYRLWRNAVLERDNYTCKITGNKNCILAVHHINSFADNPELRFDVDNGFTMEMTLHDKFHQIYGRKNNTMEQLEEFKASFFVATKIA